MGKFKSKIGFIIRGVTGWLQNNFEQVPRVPPQVQRFIIGTTSARAIECFKVGSGDLKVLFVSGIHGNEVGSFMLGCYVSLRL